MVPQSYPLYLCTVPEVVKDKSNSRSIENVCSMLSTFTFRVVGWKDDVNRVGVRTLSPLVVVNGRKDPTAIGLHYAADFQGPCYYSDTKIGAVSEALISVYGTNLPVGWKLSVTKSVGLPKD